MTGITTESGEAMNSYDAVLRDHIFTATIQDGSAILKARNSKETP